MNNKEKLLEEWQERLGLQDWAITLGYGYKIEELKTDNSNAETEWALSIKNATIRIVDEKYDKDGSLAFDFEQILVHELLHLKFAIFDVVDNSYESHIVDELRHQLVDDLARALVMAKRNETKRKLNCDKFRIVKE